MNNLANDLQHEWHAADAVWSDASQYWRDRKAVEFMNNHWGNLASDFSVFFNLIVNLEQEIDASRHGLPD